MKKSFKNGKLKKIIRGGKVIDLNPVLVSFLAISKIEEEKTYTNGIFHRG